MKRTLCSLLLALAASPALGAPVLLAFAKVKAPARAKAVSPAAKASPYGGGDGSLPLAAADDAYNYFHMISVEPAKPLPRLKRALPQRPPVRPLVLPLKLK